MPFKDEKDKKFRAGFAVGMEMAAVLLEVRNRNQDAEAVRGLRKSMLKISP